MKLHLLLILALFSWPLQGAYGAPPIEIKVGAYLFAPFIKTKQNKPLGLTPDLIHLLNQQQSDFHFTLVHTSPKRRYMDFDRHLFDALFFESKKWGWQEKAVVASDVFLHGGEVYITAKSLLKDQSFFQALEKKTLLGILGYHYGFADFNADESWLKAHYNIDLVNHPSTLINQILAKKSQIGIVTESYLYSRFKQDPTLKSKILTSTIRDQTYHHTILIRKTSPLSINQVNKMLQKIKGNGQLTQLLQTYGLSDKVP